MNTYFPSPPSSPLMNSDEKVMCGSCDKPLSSDWFCSDCHTKCTTCNRFLGDAEYCTRCWTFDIQSHSFIQKEYHYDYVRLYMMYHHHHQQHQQQIEKLSTKDAPTCYLSS